MRVLSVLPPRDGCVGESLDPVLGMCLFCSFLVGLCSAEACIQCKTNKK